MPENIRFMLVSLTKYIKKTKNLTPMAKNDSVVKIIEKYIHSIQ